MIRYTAHNVSTDLAVAGSSREVRRHPKASPYALYMSGVQRWVWTEGNDVVSARTDASRARFLPRRRGSSVKKGP